MRGAVRIAIATTSYPRDGDDPSGHFVRAHARALAREGAEVVVLAAGEGDATFERPGAGQVRVVRLGGGALFGWPGVAARASEAPLRLAVAPGVGLRALRAVWAEGRFDRVVAHWIPCAMLFAATRAPLHVVAHGADVRLLVRAPKPVRDVALRLLVAREARLQIVSSQLRDELLAAVGAPLRDEVARRSFVEAAPFELPDVPLDGDVHARLGLDTPYVAWLGRLVAGKRPGLAIEAAELAGRTLVIVGDGPLEGSLAERVRGLGDTARPRVVLAGRLPRDRAIAVMRGADAVLHTSAAEGASTVIREARALGVPVVACASGDLVAWAARDAGIEVVTADAPSLAAALTHACHQPRSIAHHGAPS